MSQESIAYHKKHPAGKIEIIASKKLESQKDLSLAYTPGVATPCLEIEKNPELAYEYTSKGNLVALVSNGTAVLGLGDLGALASKPVIEGKAVLFKKFGGVNAIDIELDSTDTDEIVNCVKLISTGFGGINLEDIKAPECFIIEDALRKLVNIPVFHDDQHGTAIIVLAGLMNASKIAGKELTEMKLTFIGAGAASIACMRLLESAGMPNQNITVCDSKGVVYKGREDGMNKWKERHARDTDKRSIADALEGSDAVIGVSRQGLITQEMVKTMNERPIVFALANPNPEILPEQVKAVRPDAIMATGRSDMPNQINNVMGFPYIFRGILDCRATEINNDTMVAASRSIAELAREDVPQEVLDAYPGQELKFGPDYIVPKPFDRRLFYNVSAAVAISSTKTGVAQNPIDNAEKYKKYLKETYF